MNSIDPKVIFNLVYNQRKFLEFINTLLQTERERIWNLVCEDSNFVAVDIDPYARRNWLKKVIFEEE